MEQFKKKCKKWFYRIQIININNQFINSCRNGDIKMAKWLYSLGEVDIHAKYDKAFRHSCINNHLEISQWLYYLSFGSVNIHEFNDYAFRWSCINNHIEVAKWLQTLCKNYKLDICNDEITKYWISNDLEALVKEKKYDEIVIKMKYKTYKNEGTCMICYEENSKKIAIKCKHDFCLSCLLEWKYIEHHNECPYCRQNICFYLCNVNTQ